ncbi:MAG TPA: GNAT family protein [Streptosporangiaceae bacterium]
MPTSRSSGPCRRTRAGSRHRTGWTASAAAGLKARGSRSPSPRRVPIAPSAASACGCRPWPGRAMAGYSVVPSARGRGFASAALIALTSFGWTIPALHRIELYIEPWNTGSIGTAERAGYQREGLLRSHQEIGGRRRDMLLYASVRDADS